MALVIRFRQQGKNNRRSYRLVVTDRRSPRDGKYVETLGWYDPLGKENQTFHVNQERLQYWLSKGALMSEKSEKILIKATPELIRDWKEKKIKKKKRKQKKEE